MAVQAHTRSIRKVDVAKVLPKPRVTPIPNENGQLSRGILTLAYGAKRYVNMAKVLARSLMLYNNDIPRALVTDSTDPELAKLYDLLIPLKPAYGSGVRQKLYLDHYSPFEKTLFIDSDCIVVRPIGELWSFFSEVPFGVAGTEIREGKWYMDVRSVLDRFGLEVMPKFNGGVYYFDRSETAKSVFETARNLADQYKQIGIDTFRGDGPNDESVYALSLGLHNIASVRDNGYYLHVPRPIQGPLVIDVYKGVCIFNKMGYQFSPAIVHFISTEADSYPYRREAFKLMLTTRWPRIPRSVLSIFTRLLFAPTDILYVVNKRFRTGRQSRKS